MKRHCQKTMTLGTAALAAAGFASLAKLREEASPERNVRISSKATPEDSALAEARSFPARVGEPGPVTAGSPRVNGGGIHPGTTAVRHESSSNTPERTRSMRAGATAAGGSHSSSVQGRKLALETGDGALSNGETSDPVVEVAGPVIEEARLPVALAAGEQESAGLTEVERDAIRKHTEEFQKAVDSVSHLEQDDPEYFDAWKAAQRRRDEQLRLTLGWEAFNRLSAQAAANVTEAP